MTYNFGKNCHLFHSLNGYYPNTFMKLMREQGRDPDPEKFITFYMGGNSIAELEKNMGLDIREIICCASKIKPAVTFHRPYGLILSGDIKAMFDNDSGIIMSPNGTYLLEDHYNFAHKTDLQTLMTEWYDKFSQSSTFMFNEVILKKGSKIVGAFHDSSINPEKRYTGYSTFEKQEYSLFLEKIDKLGLELVQINAKFK